MILVLAGTKDGRELVAQFAKHDFKVMASVVSDYGRELVQREQVLINANPLDTAGLVELIRTNDIHLVVDASHPYAANVSQNAMQACNTTGKRYIRYERPSIPLPKYDKLYIVHDYAEAAATAAKLGQVIFLTTGSRNLKAFKACSCFTSHRLIARVLPDVTVLAECLALGFTPRDIIAMQGPFSHELNIAMFKDYGAEVIITKNSGKVGGSDTKITAAMELNLPLVVIERPKIKYSNIVYSADEIISFVKETN